MPDGHGYCEFEDLDPSVAEENWIEDNCHGCAYNFSTYDEDRSDELANIRDEDGNPAVMVRYESRCPYGRGEGLDAVSFPCAAGHHGPGTNSNSRFDGPMPPMAYTIELHASTGVGIYTYAWIQACDLDDPSEPKLTMVYRSINAFDDHKVCWGDENSVPTSLPAVVATYCDAAANADLLDPASFSMYRDTARKATPTKVPPGACIGPGYDAALLVSIQQHRSAYLLLRATGMQAADGVIAAGLKYHTANGVKGFATDPDANGNYWFFVLDPTGNVDGSQALLLGQLTLSPCTSTPHSSSALAAPAAS